VEDARAGSWREEEGGGVESRVEERRTGGSRLERGRGERRRETELRAGSWREEESRAGSRREEEGGGVMERWVDVEGGGRRRSLERGRRAGWMATPPALPPPPRDNTLHAAQHTHDLQRGGRAGWRGERRGEGRSWVGKEALKVHLEVIRVPVCAVLSSSSVARSRGATVGEQLCK